MMIPRELLVAGYFVRILREKLDAMTNSQWDETNPLYVIETSLKEAEDKVALAEAAAAETMAMTLR